jgi:hypothetical protein
MCLCWPARAYQILTGDNWCDISVLNGLDVDRLKLTPRIGSEVGKNGMQARGKYRESSITETYSRNTDLRSDAFYVCSIAMRRKYEAIQFYS